MADICPNKTSRTGSSGRNVTSKHHHHTLTFVTQKEEPCRGTEPFNSIQLVLPSGDILHLSLAGQVENEYFIWRSQYQYHWYWYKSLGDRWFKLLTPLTSHTRQIVKTGRLCNRKFLHNFGLISNVNLDEPCLNVCYIFCVELNVCFFYKFNLVYNLSVSN